MTVKLNGERLEGVEGLTFAELIEHVRGILDQEVLVDLRLDQETVSQAFLDKVKDKPIYGQIDLFSMDAYTLIAEVVEKAFRYLKQLEESDEAQALLDSFEWLNRALALIPLGMGLPKLQTRVEQLLEENRRLREEVARNSSLGGEELHLRLKQELAAYNAVFSEIERML